MNKRETTELRMFEEMKPVFHYTQREMGVHLEIGEIHLVSHLQALKFKSWALIGL